MHLFLPFVHDTITTIVQNVFLQPQYTDLNAAYDFGGLHEKFDPRFE